MLARDTMIVHCWTLIFDKVFTVIYYGHCVNVILKYGTGVIDTSVCDKI